MMMSSVVIIVCLYLLLTVTAVPINKIPTVEPEPETDSVASMEQQSAGTNESATDDYDDSSSTDSDFTVARQPSFTLDTTNEIPRYDKDWGFGSDLQKFSEQSGSDSKSSVEDTWKPKKVNLETQQYAQLGEPEYQSDQPTFDRNILLKMRKQGLRLRY